MLRRVVAVSVGALVLLMPAVGSAQTDDGVVLGTAYPGVVAEPGSTASFDLTVTGGVGVQAELDVRGLPDRWVAGFNGSGSTVDRVSAAPAGEDPTDLRLDVQVPHEAEQGRVEFDVLAEGFALPLSITVQPGAAGSVTLTPDFPGLRGPSDGDFTFNVTVANDTPADVELELTGLGPEGWNVSAEPTGQSQASAISVSGGETVGVDLSVSPPPGVQAGLYEVGMTATGEGVDASVQMQVELIGDVALDVTTPDDRLNAEASGGETTELPLVVFNTGSAPLVGVSVSATPPAEWDVSLSPEVVPQIAPGESATFTAAMTPSAEALAGDYEVTFSADAEGASDSVAIRTTVTPSAVWGLVGIGLIALTLAALALVFRRFGRR